MRKEFVVSNRNGDSWRFQPKMKETPSIEGAFLVSETPPSGRHRGGVLVTVVVWLPSPVVSPTLNRTDNLRIRGEDDALPRM